MLDRLRTALSRRYVIERELGRGGMATVYLAVDKRHDRKVAMKVFPPELAAAIGPERFRREIAITSRLMHPHILALHDSGEAAGALYYVMPLVQGESLRERIDRAPEGIPADEVVSLGEQIASALSHAHRLGIVHRDVTPGNILIADGHALLADFGIARLLEGDDTITETGTPLGTAMYRSPEQAAGHTNVDGRSDTYSLGCVLYESLGGTAAGPFLSNRFAQPVPRLRQLKPSIPESVEAAVSRAMMPNPDDRFASADEFARALKSAPPVDRRRRLSVRVSRIAIAAVLVLVIAALGFRMIRSREPALAPKRVLVAQFENRTGDSSLNVLGEMADDYVARGLAETQLVEVIDARVGKVAGSSAPTSAATIRALAQSLGAATSVGGSYYRNGDTLYFETQILDTRSGKLVMSTRPAIGSLRQRMQVVEQLRQRLMTSFAVMFGPDFTSWQAESIPPSYDAYREVLAAGEAIWRLENEDALAHLRRAVAMDSTYKGAQTMMVLAAALGGDCKTADSVAAKLEGSIARLAAVDRGQLEWGRAQCQGNWQASLEAGRAVMAAAPRSISFSVLLGITALELFRPREALAVLGSVDPNKMAFTGAQRGMHAYFTMLAYRELGEPRKELDVIRGVLRNDPDDLGFKTEEMIARIELGEVAEVRQERDMLVKRSDLFAHTYWTQGQLDLCLSMEFRAHGYSAESQSSLRDAAEWYRVKSHDPEAEPVPIVCTNRLLAPLYYLGHWDEARALYQRMLATDSTSILAHEGLGALAARQRDLDEVHRMEQWLSAHAGSENGRSTYARARIAALLLQPDRAVALLEQAFNEGLSNRMFIELDPDLESVRNLPGYRQLFAIQG